MPSQKSESRKGMAKVKVGGVIFTAGIYRVIEPGIFCIYEHIINAIILESGIDFYYQTK